MHSMCVIVGLIAFNNVEGSSCCLLFPILIATFLE